MKGLKSVLVLTALIASIFLPVANDSLTGLPNRSSNVQPIANCGGNRTAPVGENIMFDGSSSYDPDKTLGWFIVEPLPTPRRTLAAEVFGGRLYVFGGGVWDPRLGYVPSNLTEVYDPQTDTWSAGAPMPTARELVSVASLEGRLYVIGGAKLQDDDPNLPLSADDVEAYDPMNDTWEVKKPLPRSPNQGWAAAATVGQSIVVVMNDGLAYMYNPIWDTWTERASVPVVVGNHVITSYDGKVYLFGGINTPQGLSNQTWIYDPGKDTWTSGPPMPTARRRLAAASWEDKMYAVGGSPVGYHPMDVVEIFDPALGEWRTEAPLPTRRLFLAAAATDDALFAIGGQGLSWVPVDSNEMLAAKLRYRWDFGDGSTPAEGELVSHVYGTAGTYLVTLTVTDPKGAKGMDTCTVIVTVANQPPSADAGDSYTVQEGSSVTFDASASTDPENDPLQFRWDFDSDGMWDTSWSSDPTAVHTWGDDFEGVVVVEVTDGTGSSQAAAAVHIDNVPPTLDAETSATATGNLTLRVAGEKFHDASLTLYEDGVEVATATVYRVPGNPDEQAATIEDVSIDLLSGTRSAVVEYTPLDDPINGRVWGANPSWLIFTLSTGEEARLHHTFNVRHEDTWVWEVPDLKALLVGLPITFEATATDPGSDDLTFKWGWGGGTADTVTTYYNDGVGPDPFPSPDVNPISVTDTVTHAFYAAGDYAVTLTVADDDGGIAVTVIPISL